MNVFVTQYLSPRQNAITSFRLAALLALTAALVGIYPAPVQAQPYPNDRLGINTGPLNGRSMEFVDVAKNANRFSPLGDAATLPLDNSGWPEADFRYVALDLRPCCGFFPEGLAERTGNPLLQNSIDSDNPYEPDAAFGTYHLSFTGQADINTNVENGGNVTVANVAYDEATNITTAEVTLTRDDDPIGTNGDIGDALLVLRFENTKRTPSASVGSGVTDIKLIRPGFDPGNYPLFYPAFVEALEPFDKVRYIGWLQPNENPNVETKGIIQVDWSDRKLPTDASQKGPTVEGRDWGTAWEYVIQLSNLTDTDPWIHVPIHASNNYIQNLAQLFAADLEPGLTVYVEYANEVWNGLFETNKWLEGRAGEVLPGNPDSPLNYDGEACLNEACTEIDRLVASRRLAAKRTVEIAQGFRDAFSDDSRVKPILSWYIGGAPVVDNTRDMLEFVKNVYDGPVSDQLWGIATTGYYGIENISESSTVQDILDEFEQGIPSYYDTFDALANDYGLTSNVYEGGDNTATGDLTAVANRIKSARAERNGELIKQDILGTFYPQGGDVYMYFHLAQKYSRFGTWGATDDINKLYRDFQYAALQDVAETDPPDPTFEPDAQFMATPASGAPPLAVSFDASASSDPDGTIASYAWDFGDGESGSGETVSHTYQSAGEYTATLTVTDDDGATATAEQTITVTGGDQELYVFEDFESGSTQGLFAFAGPAPAASSLSIVETVPESNGGSFALLGSVDAANFQGFGKTVVPAQDLGAANTYLNLYLASQASAPIDLKILIEENDDDATGDTFQKMVTLPADSSGYRLLSLKLSDLDANPDAGDGALSTVRTVLFQFFSNQGQAVDVYVDYIAFSAQPIDDDDDDADGSATIAAASIAPTIDGSAGDAWSDASAYPVDNVIAGTTGGASDLSGTWKALWDTDRLYYLVEITDDTFTDDDDTAYEDDSPEIYIDAGNEGNSSRDGAPGVCQYGENDFQLTFDPATGEVEAGYCSVKNTEGVVFEIAQTADGYTLEASIPWATFGVTPAEGDTLGTDVHANDDDDGGARDAKIAWTATEDLSYAQPSTFGDAVLEGSPLPPTEALTVSAPDTSVAPLETIRVPIAAAGDVTTVVDAFEFDLVYDGDLLDAVGVITAGTASEGAFYSSNVDGDTVKVAVAAGGGKEIFSTGPAPEAPLLYVEFRAQDTTGASTLAFSKFFFNEGEPAAAVQDGEILITEEAVRYGDLSGNGAITAGDAQLVLEAVVGLLGFSARQRRAADVTGSGTISAFDGAYILDFAVGAISCFPVEDGCIETPAVRPALAAATRSATPIGRLRWGAPRRGPDGALLVPLHVSEVDGRVRSLELDVRLDPARVEVVDIQAADETWLLAHHVSADGRLQAALVGRTPLSAGDVLTLRLRVKQGAAPPRLAGRARLNEAPAQALRSRALSSSPTAFALEGNYPNPFSRRTTITIDLPAPAAVRVEVYDALGRQLRSTTRRMGAGAGRGITFHAKSLAAGMYLYRVVAAFENGRRTAASGQMVLVR